MRLVRIICCLGLATLLVAAVEAGPLSGPAVDDVVAEQSADSAPALAEDHVPVISERTRRIMLPDGWVLIIHEILADGVVIHRTLTVARVRDDGSLEILAEYPLRLGIDDEELLQDIEAITGIELPDEIAIILDDPVPAPMAPILGGGGDPALDRFLGESVGDPGDVLVGVTGPGTIDQVVSPSGGTGG